MTTTIIKANAVDFIPSLQELDLVVTDPPYAFGGSGDEHALSATVAITLREVANKLKRGSWLIVFSASSWRSINYVVEATRNIVTPVRVATWTKPSSRTKVRTIGWEWASVSVIALRKGPKNREGLHSGCKLLDHISEPSLKDGRRAELPPSVARWAVSPFVVEAGMFYDPFAGSGALVKAAQELGMDAIGTDINAEESDALETT